MMNLAVLSTFFVLDATANCPALPVFLGKADKNSAGEAGFLVARCLVRW